MKLNRTKNIRETDPIQIKIDFRLDLLSLLCDIFMKHPFWFTTTTVTVMLLRLVAARLLKLALWLTLELLVLGWRLALELCLVLPLEVLLRLTLELVGLGLKLPALILGRIHARRRVLSPAQSERRQRHEEGRQRHQDFHLEPFLIRWDPPVEDHGRVGTASNTGSFASEPEVSKGSLSITVPTSGSQKEIIAEDL